MRKAVNNILPLNRKFGQTLAKSLKLDLNQIAEFYILLDEPHRIYKPNDEVSGQVILILKKNLTDVFITLALIGLVKISSDGSALRGSKKSYLFNHSITLYGGTNSNTDSNTSLAKGEHRFPFIVKLPKKNIYTNVSFEKGEIRYSLKASISDSTHIDHHPSLTDNDNENNVSSQQQQQSQAQLQLQPQPSNTNEDDHKIKNENSRSKDHSILSCERYLNIIKPINILLLPPPQPKVVSFKQSKKSHLKKTISSTSTINSNFSLQDNTTLVTNSQQHLLNPNGATTGTGDSSSMPGNSPDYRSDEPLTPLEQGNANSSVAGTPSSNSEFNSFKKPSVGNIQDVSGTVVTTPASGSQSQPSPGSSSTSSPSHIKISLQVSSSGYLKGEHIPVKINVQHYKNIRNVNGIIVTLIRICRIDLGSDHALQSFRKDLAQSILPIYIDPQTYNCQISTTLKIPIDVFPTIVGCDLVSFQYYIEAVVNLSNSGSSSNKLNNFNFNHQNKPQIDHGLDDEDLSNVLGLNKSSHDLSNSSSQSTIYNVDRLKRMKNVITLTNEIVIGTDRKFISKLRRKLNSNASIADQGQQLSPNNVNNANNSNSSSPLNSQSNNSTPISSPVSNSNYQSNNSTNSNNDTNTTTNNNYNNNITNTNRVFDRPVNLNPQPQLTNTTAINKALANLPTSLPELPPPISNLSEKEILRQREEALLPSQPPQPSHPYINLQNNLNQFTDSEDVNNDYLHSSSNESDLENENYAEIPPASPPPPLSLSLNHHDRSDNQHALLASNFNSSRERQSSGPNSRWLESDSDYENLDYVPAYEETNSRM